MEMHISALGYEIWQLVINGNKAPSIPPTDSAGNKAYENNARAKNAVLCGLVETKIVKVMHCNLAKRYMEIN